MVAARPDPFRPDAARFRIFTTPRQITGRAWTWSSTPAFFGNPGKAFDLALSTGLWLLIRLQKWYGNKSRETDWVRPVCPSNGSRHRPAPRRVITSRVLTMNSGSWKAAVTGAPMRRPSSFAHGTTPADVRPSPKLEENGQWPFATLFQSPDCAVPRKLDPWVCHGKLRPSGTLAGQLRKRPARGRQRETFPKAQIHQPGRVQGRRPG